MRSVYLNAPEMKQKRRQFERACGRNLMRLYALLLSEIDDMDIGYEFVPFMSEI